MSDSLSHRKVGLSALDETLVKQLVAELMHQAAKNIEANVTSQVMELNRAFQREIKAEVTSSADKLFTQLLSTHAVAMTSVSQNQNLSGRLDSQDRYMRSLMSKVDLLLGRRQGTQDHDDLSEKKKQSVYGWLRWFFGVCMSGGIIKSLYSHFHK